MLLINIGIKSILLLKQTTHMTNLFSYLVFRRNKIKGGKAGFKRRHEEVYCMHCLYTVQRHLPFLSCTY